MHTRNPSYEYFFGTFLVIADLLESPPRDKNTHTETHLTSLCDAGFL